MGRSYRVIKASCRRDHRRNTGQDRMEGPFYSSLQPRLVLGVGLSQTRTDADNAGYIPMPQGQLQTRQPQTMARSETILPATRQSVPPIALRTPAAPSELGWRTVLILLIAAATATITIYLARQYLNTPLNPLSPAEQAAALSSTTFTGIIKPANEAKISAASAAIIEKIFVQIGDSVKEGQPLLELDDREAQQAVAQAKLEKESAEQQMAELSLNITAVNKRLASLRTQLASAAAQVSVAQRRAEQVPVRQRQDSPERAQAVYEQALARYQRTEGLYKRGLVSAQEFEETRAALRIAEADLQSARDAAAASANLERAQESQSNLQSELANSEQEQQLAELRGQLQRARLRQQQAIQILEAAQRRLSETTVKATRAGVVVELPVKVGDQVYAGATFTRLAQLDHLSVELPVSARLINAIKPGQHAIISLATGSSQQLAGTVTTINPIPAANLNHTVEIEFENRNNALLVGQSARIQFSLQ
ncbi:MAG: efflux RND transporter periplasmic adaptor subunit [Acidobacteriota bacterium]